MTDQDEALDETFTARLARFRKAWLVLWGALIAAILVAYAGLALFYALYPLPFSGWAMLLGGTIVVSVPLGLAFSILGLPLLPLRRWIITPNAPYIGPGYLGVAIYGPALLVLIGFAIAPEGFPTARYFAEDPEALTLMVIYELIAFLATMFFARIWRSLGMFEVDAAARARRKGLRRKT